MNQFFLKRKEVSNSLGTKLFQLKILLLTLSVIIFSCADAQQGFVQRKNHQFVVNGQPYYYIGTNYWYGSVLGLEKDKKKGN